MHAPGRSGARNGWRAMGRPVSDAACQIGSYTGSLNGRHSTAGFGRNEDRDHAGQIGHPADLRGDPGDVVGLVHRRNSTGTEQASLALRHVVGAPVVVGTGLGLGEVDVTLALQPEEHGRIQHRQVDVVLVHVLQPRLGVPRGRPGLGVAHLAAESARAVLVARPGNTGRRQPVGGCAVPVVHQRLLARFVGIDVPDPIPVLHRGVVGHGRRVLEDVPVRVDIAEPVVGTHRFPPVERSDSNHNCRIRCRRDDCTARSEGATALGTTHHKAGDSREPRMPPTAIDSRDRRPETVTSLGAACDVHVSPRDRTSDLPRHTSRSARSSRREPDRRQVGALRNRSRRERRTPPQNARLCPPPARGPYLLQNAGTRTRYPGPSARGASSRERDDRPIGPGRRGLDIDGQRAGQRIVECPGRSNESSMWSTALLTERGHRGQSEIRPRFDACHRGHRQAAKQPGGPAEDRLSRSPSSARVAGPWRRSAADVHQIAPPLTGRWEPTIE